MKPPGSVAVIDTGKTKSRLTVFRRGRVAFNAGIDTPYKAGPHYRAVHVEALFQWILTALKEARRMHPIDAIIPVAHGAAGALVDADGALVCDIFDYEEEIPDDITRAYDAIRPPFEETGSPSLPNGLNLGRQLYFQESLGLTKSARAYIPYAQYWAAKLCGALASEASSLGCHTDLWAPQKNAFSTLAEERGWRTLMPPLKDAAAPVGLLNADLRRVIGLKNPVTVYCGLHDSNAALASVRRAGSIAGAEPVFISTGTWSVIFAPGRALGRLDENRDMLANVSVEGEPTPCIRFMAGREFDRLLQGASPHYRQENLETVLAGRILALPNFTDSGGPFPGLEGSIEGRFDNPADGDRAALASLYVALMWDAMIDLVAPEEAAAPVIVEGPAATDEICSLLAGLRPEGVVQRAVAGASPSAGAASLIADGVHAPALALEQCPPREEDALRRYRQEWRRAVMSSYNTRQPGTVDRHGF